MLTALLLGAFFCWGNGNIKAAGSSITVNGGSRTGSYSLTVDELSVDENGLVSTTEDINTDYIMLGIGKIAAGKLTTNKLRIKSGGIMDVSEGTLTVNDIIEEMAGTIKAKVWKVNHIINFTANTQITGNVTLKGKVQTVSEGTTDTDIIN